MYPGHQAQEAASFLAEFFNSISREYTPLDTGNLPQSHRRVLPTLSVQEVSKRLRKAKNPTLLYPAIYLPSSSPSTLTNLPSLPR